MSLSIAPRLTTPQRAIPATAAASGISLEMVLTLGYVLLLPYQFQVNPLLRIAPSDACIIAAVLFLPFRLAYRPKAWSFWHVGILLTFAAGTLITALKDGALSTYVLRNKDLGVLLFFATYVLITTAVDDWEKLRSTLRVFISGVVIQNLIGIYVFLAPFLGWSTPLRKVFTVYNGERLSGMLLDPNAYGGILVLALLLAETASSGQKPLFGQWWLLFCRITLGVGIFFSFSRTAWISLFFAGLLLLPRKIPTAARVFVATLACGAVAYSLLEGKLLALIQKMLTRPEVGLGRGQLIGDALNRFALHPILGGGLGSFVEEEGVIVHNTALWFLADFGLIGITIFAGFTGWFFVRAWQTRRVSPIAERPLVHALVIGHVAMFVLAMGIEAFYQRHWWVVMALIGAVCQMTSSDRYSARSKSPKLT